MKQWMQQQEVGRRWGRDWGDGEGNGSRKGRKEEYLIKSIQRRQLVYFKSQSRKVEKGLRYRRDSFNDISSWITVVRAGEITYNQGNLQK